MGLRDRDVIDMLLRDPEDGTPELLMYDSGEIKDEQRRHQLFQDKLLAYAAFVDGGQFRENFPEATADQLRVRVICSRPPNGSMESVQSVVLGQHPGVRLPVVFELEQDMRRRVKAAAGPTSQSTTGRPWWRFWR